ncbi:MAG: hypothetical protein ISR45_10915 [Rhodospirillales bacterium]|nr:hypothetical protein [Rhodospirillales bacterium]
MEGRGEFRLFSARTPVVSEGLAFLGSLPEVSASWGASSVRLHEETTFVSEDCHEPQATSRREPGKGAGGKVICITRVKGGSLPRVRP